ncbi:glycosyltransferase [Morganella morganii]|uniref:glycosyltransferase n=1 Tax=Morganella morganii TaxID=582 RepID=UPI00040A75ED|nr:glycosyltransferase [Morganella morganii]HCR3332710.1 glycosyltransferase [Morganella morganii]
MKILYFITGLGMGGAEKQLISIINNFNEDHVIKIISLSSPEKIAITPDSNNIEIISLSIKKNIFSLIKALIKVRRIILNFNPNILHSHMFHANIFARILHLIIRPSVLICTAHSKNEGGKLRMFLYRITDPLTTISTNVSQEAVNTFIEKKAVKPGRMIPLYNGIDTDIFSYNRISRKMKRDEIGVDDNTPLILSVGRLTEAKDYPNLFYAFSSLETPVQPKLVIIGDGEEKERLKNLSEELGISDNIIWLGIRHDVQDWMSACDLFVLPSAWEGFGLVVAEAMACKRVVIGTDSGGVSEVIGDAGFIIPIKNSQSLTEYINMALSLSSEERQELGNKARQHIINNFSLTTISQQWLDLYNKLSK